MGEFRVDTGFIDSAGLLQARNKADQVQRAAVKQQAAVNSVEGLLPAGERPPQLARLKESDHAVEWARTMVEFVSSDVNDLSRIYQFALRDGVGDVTASGVLAELLNGGSSALDDYVARAVASSGFNAMGAHAQRGGGWWRAVARFADGVATGLGFASYKEVTKSLNSGAMSNLPLAVQVAGCSSVPHAASALLRDFDRRRRMLEGTDLDVPVNATGGKPGYGHYATRLLHSALVDDGDRQRSFDLMDDIMFEIANKREGQDAEIELTDRNFRASFRAALALGFERHIGDFMEGENHIRFDAEGTRSVTAFEDYFDRAIRRLYTTQSVTVQLPGGKGEVSGAAVVNRAFVEWGSYALLGDATPESVGRGLAYLRSALILDSADDEEPVVSDAAVRDLERRFVRAFKEIADMGVEGLVKKLGKSIPYAGEVVRMAEAFAADERPRYDAKTIEAGNELRKDATRDFHKLVRPVFRLAWASDGVELPKKIGRKTPLPEDTQDLYDGTDKDPDKWVSNLDKDRIGGHEQTRAGRVREGIEDQMDLLI
mgnify:CR=1 FL=1